MYNRIKTIMGSGSIPGYFLQVVPITVVVALLYCVIRLIILKKKNIKIVWKNELIKLVFVCYLTGLLNLIVMPANYWLYIMDAIVFGWWGEVPSLFSVGEFNLIPGIFRLIQGELTMGSWVKQMLIGNIAMFLPFGLLLPFISKKVNLKNIFVVAALVPLSMEVLQLILGRSFDIDDLICNFIGIAIGFIAAYIVKVNFDKKTINNS